MACWRTVTRLASACWSDSAKRPEPACATALAVERARMAIVLWERSAISSPLLEETIAGARGILFNISAGPDLTLAEVNDVLGQLRRGQISGRVVLTLR